MQAHTIQVRVYYEDTDFSGAVYHANPMDAKTIGGHKVQLQQLLRDVEMIKAEAHEAVADIITSKQEKEIADMEAWLKRHGR